MKRSEYTAVASLKMLPPLTLEDSGVPLGRGSRKKENKKKQV